MVGRTPRVWLEQGKEIIVKNAPTYFGTLAYEIVSDVDNGKIIATVTIPDDGNLESVLLRLRHPKAFSIKCNGQRPKVGQIQQGKRAHRTSGVNRRGFCYSLLLKEARRGFEIGLEVCLLQLAVFVFVDYLVSPLYCFK